MSGKEDLSSYVSMYEVVNYEWEGSLQFSSLYAFLYEVFGPAMEDSTVKENLGSYVW